MGFSRQEYWSGVPLPSPTFPLLPRLYQGEAFREHFSMELPSCPRERGELDLVSSALKAWLVWGRVQVSLGSSNLGLWGWGPR